MDVLTDVMQTMRVRSNLYGRVELTAPWGIRADGECGHAGFLAVLRGSCWLDVAGAREPVPLAGGDFVLLPKGSAHTLRDARKTPTRPVQDVMGDWDGRSVLRHGGGGLPTSLVFGCFEFEDGGRNSLVESLPPLIHVRADSGPSVQWLQSTVQFIATETASGLPGAETVASRLTDILFVHAVRAYLAGCGAKCSAAGDGTSGWLRALAHPKIGQALRLVHESPEKNWTVESLAGAVAMSRSAFAGLFTELVGEPPLRYLSAWRVKKASGLLLRGDPISAVATTVGYSNDAAFGKVFKRHVGITPGEFRRSVRAPAPSTASAPAPSRRTRADAHARAHQRSVLR